MTTLDRRAFLALGAGAFVVATFPFTSRRGRLIQRRLPLMGTIGEIGVVHQDPRVAHAAIDTAFEALIEVERLMTRFHRRSDIGRANFHAAREGVAVAPATALVVREALAWAAESAGAFDPALGRLVELWDVTARHVPPASGEFGRLAGRRLYRAVDVSIAGGQPALRFSNADVALDLGGIAKGYGVDCAVAALRAAGIRDGLVNVGGDLYALGRSPDGDPWSVGIRSPVNPGTLVGRIELTDRAVATSGDYVQFFDHQGRRYHHLLDPATAAPRLTPWHSVSVTADHCMIADVAATAAFGMAATEATGMLRRRSNGSPVLVETAM